jgi:hypothetical protein
VGHALRNTAVVELVYETREFLTAVPLKLNNHTQFTLFVCQGINVMALPFNLIASHPVL